MTDMTHSQSAATDTADAREGTAVAFTIAAMVAVLFNTLLAWAKESIPALEELMKAITGHHWWTHALFDLIVFFAVGLILMRAKSGSHVTRSTSTNLIGAVVIAGLGLVIWFTFI